MNNDKYPQRIDYGVILSIMLLAIISILSLYSTTVLIQGHGIGMTLRQIVWYGLGVLAISIIMQFNSEQLWKMTTYLYIVGIVILLLTLLFYDRNMALSTGGKRWVRLGPIGTIQPSEFVKIPYILMLAKTVTKHNSIFDQRDYHTDFLLLGKIAFLSLLPIVLVFMQNDLGTALVYISIAVGIVLLSGVKWQILLPIFLVIATVGATLIILVVYNREILLNTGLFKPYQFARIDTWLNPHQGANSTSYQIVQTFKAIGSGGVFGKGFGVSEVYVPVRESDMIFATIGENFGFTGGAFLIFVYFVLIYHMVKVIYDTKNEFYAYVATGVIMMIMFHVFENIGMNIGLLPMTGIPLPFVSQGGSSLLGNMMGIGLIMSMRYHHKSYFFSGDGKEFHTGV
ncbi:FtsW/RodA/SpoVE family cell cycle protein [Alkalibacterium sp. 20]|uniref:FtsW/RodA/SpoVE family cell cycle protein n=1 Tax=Alkalibacterium sp. 20 TaxID=1798803 RepID=UPI000900312E|nr:FtsW/RodA/SpoVE family cell cycle protein [Alkalibacterium sp. 20]OJF90125.1 rod shape-determining protein RodA [Alkalibacterium sp. 20]